MVCESLTANKTVYHTKARPDLGGESVVFHCGQQLTCKCLVKL